MKAKLSWVAAVVGGVVACGSSGSDGGGANANGSDAGSNSAPDAGPAPGDDAGTDAAPSADAGDHGAPSTTYPAFTPSFAQLKKQSGGGTVMAKPVVVAITWDADPQQAAWDSFADNVGATKYWKTASSEYGVGAAESGAINHVHIADPAPATIDDAAIQAMVTAHAGVAASPDAGAGDAGSGAAWPDPSHDTIFAFFLPPKTSLQTPSFGGTGGSQDACAAGEGGYHDQVTVGSTVTSYAVVPSCTFPSSLHTAAEQTTMSMSHELLEAATDPQPSSTPTYLGFDDGHFSFDYFQELQVENGDACEFYSDSFFENKETSPAFDAWVQRTWSNASAIGGHDPCVPAPATPYFNVTPLDLEDVGVTIPAIATQLLPGMASATKGYKATAGGSVTFAVGLYSDAATSGPWKLSVAPGNPVLGSKSLIEQYNPSQITASIDLTSGQNGQKAYVTVNVASVGTLFAGEIVTITSTLGGVSHYMPVWIAGK